MSDEPSINAKRPGLGALLRESLLLGTLGFGGGLSVLALIRSRAVERHRWLNEREFTNAATVAQMLPGGAAANALAWIGLRFRGHAGAAVAYAGFCLPGFLAVLALARLYDHVGTTPLVASVLGGVNAAVVGIIASITVRMLRRGVARLWQIGVSTAALLVAMAGGSPLEVAILGIACGLAVDIGLKRSRAARIGRAAAARVALPEEGDPVPRRAEDGLRSAAIIPVALAAVALADPRTLQIALVFFRTGLGAYGGGFAIIPHLQRLMSDHGWLGPREFADAVALGKLTPGPVLLMATFIGYRIGGLPLAFVATFAILLGPWLLVVAIGSAIERSRNHLAVRAALRGLTPAVVGLMAASALALGHSLEGPLEIGIAAAAALALIRFPINPALVLVLASIARVGAYLLRG